LAFVFLLCSAAAADRASDAFNEGKRLMGKGKHAQACAQFRKAEEAAGPNVKTRYWMGRCNEEQGKKANAFLAYKDAKRMAVKAGDTKRAKVIDTRISELGQILPFLVLTIPEDMQAVEGLALARDGENVPRSQWGAPFPVDIGKHEITVSAPGYEPVTLKVTASEPGSKAQLVIPTLTKASSGGAPPNPQPGTDPKAPVPLPDPGVDEGQEMERKNAGLFWTGVGLVSAGGLAIVGGLALVAIEVADDSPDFGDNCDPTVEDCSFIEEEQSTDRIPGAVALLITGGVFLGVGIPFMAVFGKKVPAEKDEEGEKEAFTIEPVITPGGFKVRGTF
jgi:hypothetical protein